ncbi:MAG: diaminopimelate decarboxylase, partial [Bacteroidota bacterium]|nr:diaminopimelate decarboxylase [Bacteroidota bacterium]
IDNSISDFKNFISLFNKNIFLNDKQIIHFELGRSIVGQCGFLISKVLFIKKSYEKNYVIIDAGMNDLIRPALYNTYHKVINITSKSPEKINYDVVGPVCESSDTFAYDYPLPITNRDDFIVICSAGAYGQSMSSNYNLRNKLKSYYSDTI